MEDILQVKKTFDGRQLLMENEIGWKTTLVEDKFGRTTFDERQPSLEENFQEKTIFTERQLSMQENLQWVTPSLEVEKTLLMEDEL